MIGQAETNSSGLYRLDPSVRRIRAGKQDPFFAGGHAWLLRQFARLDCIRRATVIER